MLLPVGDLPNPKSTPLVNYALMGLNIVVFILVTLPLASARPDINDPLLVEYLRTFGGGGPWSVQDVYRHVSAYDLTVFQYGYRPAEPSLISVFSAMFLHGSGMHLAGNMLFLWIFGDNVEHRLGHVGYLVTYLLAGLAATLFFGLFVPGSQVPLIGASGAISGVLGCYFLWFPKNQVKIFIFLFPFVMTTVLISARWVLGFYLLIDNLLPFLATSQQGGGVAHGAHIGGFLGGAGLAYGVDRLPGFFRQKSQVREQDRAPFHEVDPVAQVVTALNTGNLAHAAASYPLLTGSQERNRLATGNLLTIGDFLLQSGEPEQALTLFRRLIAERPGDASLDRAYLGAGKAMLNKVRCETSAWHYFLAAVDLAATPELAAEARRYLQLIEERDK